MRISILTYGSRGDVQPLVALGIGLQQAGHRVVLAAPHRFAGLAAQHGIEFAPLAGDPEEISQGLNDAGASVLRTVTTLYRSVFAVAGEVLQAVQQVCEHTDLIIHSFLFTTGGHALARLHGIPDISVQGFPIFAPTRSFPNVGSANLPPGLPSIFSHWLATQIYWHGGNLGYRQLVRKSPGTMKLDLQWPFKNSSRPITPLLFSYSPVVVPRPADWTSSHIHIPGFFFLEAPSGYQPPAGLANFLADGEPPVCVTFGSMINRDAGPIARVVQAALQQTGMRAVVLTGWGSQIPDSRPESLYSITDAPHDWLLPRCAAVIHHGGAGTTAAGLRAGIPTIVIPHAADQPFWGKRVAAIGAGPAPLHLKDLTVDRLAAALEQTRQPAMQTRAAEIGRQVRAENGVANAVQIIEHHAALFKLR